MRARLYQVEGTACVKIACVSGGEKKHAMFNTELQQAHVTGNNDMRSGLGVKQGSLFDRYIKEFKLCFILSSIG